MMMIYAATCSNNDKHVLVWRPVAIGIQRKCIGLTGGDRRTIEYNSGLTHKNRESISVILDLSIILYFGYSKIVKMCAKL